MKAKNLLNCFLLTLLTSCNQNVNSESIFNSEESSTINESSSSSNTIEGKKRVILLGIDGAGHNFNEKNTPNIMNIFEDYAYGNDILSANPTISAQSWGSMLTGVIPSIHQFTNTSIAANKNTISKQYPTIFKQIRMQDEQAQLASFSNWNPINYGIVEDDISVHKDTHSNDDDLAIKIIEYMENNDPTFIFAQFDSVDHEGHASGYTSESYYKALKILDQRVNSIFNKVVNLGWEDDTLFIVTTDHGGLNKSHGGFSEEEKYNFFGARNKNINHMYINDMFIRDIPSIIAHHLNITPSASMDSIIPKDLFKDLKEYPTRKINFNNESLPAILFEDKNGLMKYIKKEDIKLYLPFEDNADDYFNNYKVTSRNNQYENGIHGKAIRITNQNYLSIPDLKFNNESFSISTYLHYNPVYGSDDPCLFANKDWASGLNSGIVFSLRNNDMKFNIGAEHKLRSDVQLHYPGINHLESWQHLLITYDATTSKLSFYVNFSLESVCVIPNDRLFDGDYSFNIGQDGTGVFNCALNLLMDDFIVFNKSLEKNDVDSLKEYYLNSLKKD